MVMMDQAGITKLKSPDGCDTWISMYDKENSANYHTHFISTPSISARLQDIRLSNGDAEDRLLFIYTIHAPKVYFAC